MTPTRIPILDLKRQHASMKGDLDAAIARVIDSGYFISGFGGPEVKAFEEEWARYCGVAHAVAVGSGTAALNLTLRALGVGPGDQVVTVSFTLGATLDAIIETGARPILVDVDPDTYTMDANLLTAALSSRTKAVLPVHVYGHPVDVDSILDAAGQVPVVLDACEAHGTLYRGRQVASLGTASCFSFYPSKNLNALGDAGGVVTNDAALADRVRMLRHHGWDRRFHTAISSLNSRMDEIHAAVLRAKLPRLDAWNARRREIAKRFDAALAGSSVRAAPCAAWAAPSYYLYVLATAERDALKDELAAAGIASDVYWPEPLHYQPGYSHLGYGPGSLPVTEVLCDQVLSIPMFPELSEQEIERICDVLTGFSARTAASRTAQT